MFNVGRYDPREGKCESKQNDKKRTADSLHVKSGKTKGRKKRHSEEETATTLRVIADGDTGAVRNLPKVAGGTSEEAFDDLDLVEVFTLIDDEEGLKDEMALPGEKEVKQTEAIDEGVSLARVSNEDVQLALDASRLPIEEAAKAWKLAPFLVSNLKNDGFQYFFPIQAFVIPDVITTEGNAHLRVQDICITAPTGSGKTLSYVLPCLHALANCHVRCIRALVILPSRDLASQVYTVFQKYVKGSHLKVGLAIGQSDFKAEQFALTVDLDSDDPNMMLHRLALEPTNLELAMKVCRVTKATRPVIPRSGWSTVDILVCTPGRLVDHLDSTSGFTLQHLRFLVVDEADRLLGQRYHNWIERVIESANSASIKAWKDIQNNGNKLPGPEPCCDLRMLDPITWRRGGVNGDSSNEFNTNDATVAVAASICQPVQLRKLLVSATLTRDPQKLAALRLVNPKHFDVHQLTSSGSEREGGKRYSMPDGLAEFTVECTAEQKPVVLMALLLERRALAATDQGMVVVFTSSLDSTHRLARLLQMLWIAGSYGEPDSVVEFSSKLNQRERSKMLARCNDPSDHVAVVVCSDGMSRGMDIQMVRTVINYDVPSLAKTYVHRCGRTARANRKGEAISLLKGGQAVQFSKMRQLIHDPGIVKPTQVKKNLVRDIIPIYRTCLRALPDVLDAEGNGEVAHTDILSIDLFLEPDPFDS